MDAGKVSTPAEGSKRSMDAEMISTPAEGNASTGRRSSGRRCLARRRAKLQAQKAVAEANLALAKLEEEELEEEKAKSQGRLDQSSSPALKQQFMVETARGDAGEDTGAIHIDMPNEFGSGRLGREDQGLPAWLMSDASTNCGSCPTKRSSGLYTLK
eukprot:scpid47461/ scgid35470/ 